MTRYSIPDYPVVHDECDRCNRDGQCHGCLHHRADIGDYSHGYYCGDCIRAIERWRVTDLALQLEGQGPGLVMS